MIVPVDQTKLVNLFYKDTNLENRNQEIIAVHSELAKGQSDKDDATTLKIYVSSLALLIGILALVVLAIMVVLACLPVGAIVALSLVAFFTIIPGIAVIVNTSQNLVFSKDFTKEEVKELVNNFDWDKNPVDSTENKKIVDEVSKKIDEKKASEKKLQKFKAAQQQKWREEADRKEKVKFLANEADQAYLKNLQETNPVAYQNEMRRRAKEKAASDAQWDDEVGGTYGNYVGAS